VTSLSRGWAAAMQIGVALAPALVVVLRDLTGGYAAAIAVAAALDALAVVIVLWGRGKGTRFDSPAPTR
jgi:cyanate permease